jgi:DNA-binding transcriptional ArsR family regulator
MDLFAALAEPTRRKIVELLAERGQMAASDIYQQFDATPPAISQHLKVLREAKLVKVKKQAQKRLYEVDPDGVREFELWAKRTMQRWNNQFDRLDQILQEETETK